VSALEETLATHIHFAGLPEPEREFRFHPVRRWRFDFAWPDRKLAAEVDGGTWVGGRHSRGAGAKNDCDKQNAATALGWRVLRFTTDHIKTGEALEQIEAALMR